MNERDKRKLALVFGGLQLADAAGNLLVPRRYVRAHLDHLGVPRWVQRMLVPLKVMGSAGLVLGLRWPDLGGLTAACLVGYYAAATGFHLTTPENPALALPAAAFGAAAGAVLVGVYLPEIKNRLSTAR